MIPKFYLEYEYEIISVNISQNKFLMEYLIPQIIVRILGMPNSKKNP